MTRRRGVPAEEDAALRVLAETWTPVATLVGKTWGLHLEKVVKVDREENLRMIEESVAFLVGQGKRVVYDAEHFFDGFADDPAYALRCLSTAAEAGAETVASAHPSLNEASGMAAFRADPDDAEAIAEAIEYALEHGAERLQAGLDHAARFTRHASGEAVLRGYKSVL